MQRASYVDQFELQAAARPDAVAVLRRDGPVTYGALDGRANAIAARLAQAGVGRNAIVGLFLPAGSDYVAALLATGKAGGAFLPLPPDLPEQRLRAYLNKARSRVILTHAALADDLRARLAATQAQAEGPVDVIALEDCADAVAAPPERRIGPTDAAYVMFTSGSTGAPKAILGPHRSLSHFLRWEIGEFALTEATRGSWLAPVTFDVSLRDMLVPLMVGGTLCTVDEDTRLSPRHLVEALKAAGVTLVHCVPTVLRLLTRELERRGEADPLPALKHLLVAGEPLLGADVAAWRAAAGEGAQVANLYGPSETTLAKVFHRVGDLPADLRRVLPIGRPLPDTRVLVLTNGRACAVNQIGEIHIETAYPSLGYLNDPELTAAAFIANPLEGEGAPRLYKTGDLGRLLPDGTVECLGRQDNQVKINGVRIELGEIEAALRAVPGIAAAAAALQEGEGQMPVLVGYYVRADGETAPLSVDLLKGELGKSLPPAMQPRVFLPLEALPTTISGKLNRKALPRPEELFYAQHGFVPAQSETETALAEIWAELFGLGKVSVETRFHDFGGDSLKAIRAVQKIYQALAVEVSLKDFFAAPHIRALAALVDAARPQAAPQVSIPRAAPAEFYPATPAQNRLWRLDRLGVAPTAYNLFETYELRGALDEEALERAFALLIARHDTLRTTFREGPDGAGAQVVHAELPWHLEQVDLRRHADPTGEAARLAAANGAHRFDLVAGPLMRVVLVRLPDEGGVPAHLLLFNIHHIVADVWSLSVLVRELAECYAALRQHRQPVLPALDVQMRDVAVWQAERAESGALAADRAFWLDQFATPVPPLDLPRDRARPPVQTLTGRTARFDLGATTMGAVEALAQRTGTTLFVVLAALTKAFLHRYSGQTELVLGCPVAGRADAALEHQIGYYVNTLALRDALADGESFAAFLARVGATTNAALAHQDYPFDTLVNELQIERDMSRSPLFDAMIVLQNFAGVDLTLEGVSIAPFGDRNAWNFSRYDMVFHFQEEDGALILDLNYNSDLFDADRIERAGAQFAHLAGAALEDTSLPVARLPLVPPQEAARIAEFAQGPRADRAPATLVGAFRAMAVAHADRPAVEDEDGRVLTYAALDAASDRLARLLVADHAIAAGDRVAVRAHRSIESLVALLAILKAGAVYVPVDGELPRARIDFMLARAECRLILADTDADRIADSVLPQVCVAPVLAAQDVAVQDVAAPLDRSAPGEVAYVIFTSGSTGEPKAVMVEHAGFVNMSLAQVAAFEIAPDDKVMQFASPSFDASLANLFMALFAGACVVLPSRATLENTGLFLDALARTGTSVVTLPPTYLRALDGAQLAGLKVLITAGEAAPVEELCAYADQLRAYNAYGPTEFSVCATVHRVRAEDAQGARLPIGRPLPNTSLHILDENLEPAPIGVPGEIYLGGLGLARGYQGDEGRTARAFITHPRSGARLYRTGDFGAWRADGSVDCLGRLDDQVKVAGHRVELGEVEAALRQVEGLRDVHVTRLERDDGSVALAAYYCAEEKVELWPSVAEFFVYDDVAYGAMAADEGRNARYRDAFARHLPGKSVVDIGTGPLAILARLAVEAGARKVYAVDRLEATARKARETVEKLGLSDRIEVIHGDAMTVQLPEKVDACISEIVGAIGGAEGSAKIINGARPLLADPAAMYPMFSDTRIAALSLPADQIASGFSDIAGHYVEKIFAEVGHPFDLRLCLKNCPREAIVSDDAPFEYLDYTSDAPLEADEDVALTIARDCEVTGFLVWLRLGVDERSVVDILDNPGSWLPVYLPVFDQPVAVKAGDVIALHISRRLCANGLNPDFILDGAVRRTLGDAVPFSYLSAHFGDGFRRTPFYARLFADGQVPRQEVPTPAVLRQHLLKSVPAYAVPAFFVKLDQMPVTVNGKVDKAALPLPSLRAPAAQASAPATPLEADILAIWQAVMGREAIGTGDDFFSLGGDSIRAIQIVSRLRQAGWKAEIRDVFQNPTVKDLARVVKPLRVAADQGPVTGAVPLTPIQHWFLETAEAPHHFNQSVLLRAPRIHGDAARAALAALWTQHDALRAAFVGAEGRAQVFNAPERAPTLAEIDLPAEAEADAHAFEVAADALQASFALDETPLLAALLAHGADGDRLLLVAHHLVVDAVSWSILLEDFETAYQAARAGAPPRLPQKTASYRDHALALEKIRAKVDWAHRLNFWRALEEEPALLPEWTGPARLSDMVRAEGHLDTDETTRLLEGANSAYTTNVQDLLLAALALALEQQFGRRSALVSVEGHGRDYPFADLFGEDLPDVSRTVGWFTVFHPLKVHVGGDLASTIRGVKESARRTPDQGWSYPLLRQFADEIGLAPLKPQVGFNYLGVLSGGGRAGVFSIDWNTPGQALAPQTTRPHAIEILAAVEDGKLCVSLEMAGGHFAAADAQALCARFLAQVRAVLAHCLGRGGSEATPSDFTYGDLSLDDLDRLLLAQ
ncbi:MAG: hypothetical protein B7Y95_12425 [Rhizobiales bacterium 32-66-11]|nr:MAG: hypothetical protein B7Y95_12425 [Rhizobiales bacterium 32-66-11]